MAEPAGPGGTAGVPARGRDELGRPRNPRLRDRLGRPLPLDRAGPDEHDHRPVPPIPDDLDLPPEPALDFAQRLLDEGRAFSAHEVLESVWKAAAEPERELWRSLAQLAVGLTHLERGNPAGAARLLRRAAAGLQDYRVGAPYRLAVPRLIGTAESLAARIEAGEQPTVDGMELRD